MFSGVKLIIWSIIIYFFALLQSSFFVPFSVYSLGPNLVLSFIIPFVFLNKREDNFIFYLAFIGGLFLDIFFTSYFGIFTLNLICLVFILSKFITAIDKESVFSFIFIFLFSVLFYEFFYSVANWLIGTPFYFRDFKVMIVEFLYNLIFGLIFYYFLSRITKSKLKSLVN